MTAPLVVGPEPLGHLAHRREGQLIHVARRDTRELETGLDRPGGEPVVVLLPYQPLLLHREDQLVVFEDCGGRIVAVMNTNDVRGHA